MTPSNSSHLRTALCWSNPDNWRISRKCYSLALRHPPNVSMWKVQSPCRNYWGGFKHLGIRAWWEVLECLMSCKAVVTTWVVSSISCSHHHMVPHHQPKSNESTRQGLESSKLWENKHILLIGWLSQVIIDDGKMTNTLALRDTLSYLCIYRWWLRMGF